MTDTAVMQPRCVHCLREQYAFAVAAVSRGALGCTWCGELATVYATEQAYRQALTVAYAARDARDGGAS